MATRDADAFALLAGSDCSLFEACFGKQSAGKIIPCSVLGERADVVIGNSPISGAAVDCYPRAGKLVIVRVGAVAVAQDAELTTDALACAKTAVSTNVVRCRALVAGAAGAYIPAHWVDAYIKP